MFPEEDIVLLQDEQTIEITRVGVRLKIEEEYLKKRIYLTENLTHYNEGEVYFDSFENVLSISAKTDYLDSYRNYETRKVKDFETKDVVTNGIFYGGLKSKSFLYPTIGVGSKTELKYRIGLNNPRFLNPFSFNSYVKTMDSKLTIIADEGVEIGVKVFGIYADSIKYEREVLRRNKVKHTWTAHALPKIARESGAPNAAYYRTHIIPYIEYYVNRNDTVRVMGEVDDLYEWYSSLMTKIRGKENNDLISLVEGFKETAETEDELIRTIYAWVQENIKYIAFEDGYGGFIPRSSGLVFERKYGDCKDMANLLKDMLQLAGFEEVYLSWIGTRDKPYSYEQLPTPLVDNHMITALNVDGEMKFLDATNSYTPYGFPSGFIQGKQALIGLDAEHYSLLDVPVVDKSRSQRIDSLFLEIHEDTLKGTTKRYLSGYRRVDMDRAFEKVSPSDYEKFFNNYLAKGSNAFELTGFDVSALEQKRTEETSFMYQFHLPGYVRKIRNKMYVNPILNKGSVLQIGDFEQRELGFENDYKFIDTEEIFIKVPEGYELDFVPDVKEEIQEKYGYKIMYNAKEEFVHVYFEFYLDFLLLESNEIQAFNSFIKALKGDLNSTISFREISN